MNTTDPGSSPLARGLRLREVHAAARLRIIPARAGFTSDKIMVMLRTQGSSPLARGLLAVADFETDADGIIPARAGFTGRRGFRNGRGRDHPRSRGVYAAFVVSWPRNKGSSPLARGLLYDGGDADCSSRIIPARAGFTSRTNTRATISADHPRSRGVYELPRLAFDHNNGSSPLARGLPAPENGTAKTGMDHPRSRGVYGQVGVVDSRAQGSSPLARGLPSRARSATRRCRIIPARAGFTGHHGAGSAPRKDHPRSRGVYAVSPVSWAAWTGSSPLARGLHPGARLPGAPQGIIPARAGFTSLSFLSRVPASDHPRSRGVYPAASPRGRPRPGSSPLARGLLNPVGLTTNYFRIIPARAGFTPCGQHRTSPLMDHPRSRGVYRALASMGDECPGSSPLARGLLSASAAPRPDTRIIPARAGFTAGGSLGLDECRDHPRSRGVYHGGRGPGYGLGGSSPLARGLPRG